MKNKLKFFLFDSLIVLSSFLFFIWLKPASKRIYLPQYSLPFIGFLVLWIILSVTFDKYNFRSKTTLKQYFSPVLKTSVTSLAITLLLIFIFDLLHYSRLIVLGTIILVTFLELLFSIILYSHRKIKGEFDLPSKLTRHATTIKETKLEENKEINFTLPDLDNDINSIKDSLSDRYLKELPSLFEFIDSEINLHGVHKNNSLILNTHTLYNIENYDFDSQQLFINLHKINNIRRINRFFIQVNRNLQFGGYFIGCFETIHEKYIKFRKKYPIVLFQLLYGINFLFTRILPKIPVCKELYFFFTKGNNRALSKAEVLGRLSFCGFKIIDKREIENKFYFIAQKYKLPKDDLFPSYGPLIKLQRIGEGGKYIYIFKFRTMHPYSEYLQDYIHEKNEIEIGGKFKNDFRVTGWGKVFRACWIDELPQFINLLRGDIRLVGVRALSEHYFNLYPEDVRNMRKQFKPGLVPPYYADMPKEFDEIVESERRYLESKMKQPFKTDCHYFFKVWYNIIFKGARSK